MTSAMTEVNLPGQGLAEDKADGLWCRQHLRHLSLGLTALFLILGVALTPLKTAMGLATGFQIAAIGCGLPFILREMAESLKKCTLDLSSLVLIATVGACAQGEPLDGALVVWLYNLAKEGESTLIYFCHLQDLTNIHVMSLPSFLL